MLRLDAPTTSSTKTVELSLGTAEIFSANDYLGHQCRYFCLNADTASAFTIDKSGTRKQVSWLSYDSSLLFME